MNQINIKYSKQLFKNNVTLKQTEYIKKHHYLLINWLNHTVFYHHHFQSTFLVSMHFEVAF